MHTDLVLENREKVEEEAAGSDADAPVADHRLVRRPTETPFPVHLQVAAEAEVPAAEHRPTACQAAGLENRTWMLAALAIGPPLSATSRRGRLPIDIHPHGRCPSRGLTSVGMAAPWLLSSR